MTIELCMKLYKRPDGTTLRCTFLKDHPNPCSHRSVELLDEQEAGEPAHKDVDVLVENIAGGTCDPYLEAILAAAHGRKRALRNVSRPYGRKDC